jgi:hypothetical protein
MAKFLACHFCQNGTLNPLKYTFLKALRWCKTNDSIETFYNKKVKEGSGFCVTFPEGVFD